jgi:hypothetical protein
MPRLYRAMKEDDQGLPEIGDSARCLGIRPGRDVAAVRPEDLVQPGRGGMSVSPDDPANLPYYRRPPEFGGTSRDPVWEVDDAALGPDLCYRPDPHNPGHGFIEPTRPMRKDVYEQALRATQRLWRKVVRSSIP